MATFETYQARLKELGTEAFNLRNEMEVVSGDTKKAFAAQYSRLITKIDLTVEAIKAEHPRRCWRDDDPVYQALAAGWRKEKANV